MFPTVRGNIDRRILVNFRVDPGVVADTLPEPFEPQTVSLTTQPPSITRSL